MSSEELPSYSELTQKGFNALDEGRQRLTLEHAFGLEPEQAEYLINETPERTKQITEEYVETLKRRDLKDREISKLRNQRAKDIRRILKEEGYSSGSWMTTRKLLGGIALAGTAAFTGAYLGSNSEPSDVPGGTDGGSTTDLDYRRHLNTRTANEIDQIGRKFQNFYNGEKLDPEQFDINFIGDSYTLQYDDRYERIIPTVSDRDEEILSQAISQDRVPDLLEEADWTL